MTMIRLLWFLIGVVWVGLEIHVARRQNFRDGKFEYLGDSTERMLWLTLSVSFVSALVFKNLSWEPLPIDYIIRQIIAFVCIFSGLGFRYAAITHLGRFFATKLSTQLEHKLVTDGPYRLIRHPSYTGLLLACAAAGFAMGDVMAMLVLTLPPAYAVSIRIEFEERMLTEKFGRHYLDYCRKTSKLLPWFY